MEPMTAYLPDISSRLSGPDFLLRRYILKGVVHIMDKNFPIIHSNMTLFDGLRAHSFGFGLGEAVSNSSKFIPALRNYVDQKIDDKIAWVLVQSKVDCIQAKSHSEKKELEEFIKNGFDISDWNIGTELRFNVDFLYKSSMYSYQYALTETKWKYIDEVRSKRGEIDEKEYPKEIIDFLFDLIRP